MRLILPKRFSLGNAIFSRGSTAYLDNRYADVGIPRIRRIGLSKMIMVEEGTTNRNRDPFLSDINKVSVVGVSGAAGTKEEVSALRYGTKAVKVTCTNAGIVRLYDNAPNFTWTSGETAATSCIVAVSKPSLISNFSLAIRASNGTAIANTVSQSAKLLYDNVYLLTGIFTLTSSGLGAAGLQFNSMQPGDWCIVDAWQSEQKSYSTSITSGTRSAESLTIPTAGLTPEQGTIEGIFECNEMAKRTTENQWNNLFDIPTVSNTSGIMVWHNSTSWRLETRDDSGTSSASAFIPDSLTPDGPIGYRVSWSPAKARLEFWSVENDVFKTLLASAEITNPKLPSAFASNMYIGSQNGSVNFLNTSFGRHRLSNIVRTGVPDLIVDSNTIAVLSPTYDFLR